MMPALLTQMSTGPRSRSTAATASRTWLPSRTSQAYPRATPPPAPIVFAVSSAPSALRSQTATRQPSAASTVASAWPRLRAPPVTSATRPRMPRSTLPALERGLALGEERLDALGGVLGAERLQKGARLDLERLVDGRREPVVDGLDEQARGDRRGPGGVPPRRAGGPERAGPPLLPLRPA